MRRLIKHKVSKIALVSSIILIVLLSLSYVTFVLADGQGLSGGRTESGYTLISGAIGTKGATANSSSYNLTLTGGSTPVGTGNNTNYNVSLGYIYSIDKNHSPFNLSIKINKTEFDIKRFDSINISTNITGEDELSFGWIVDNITGTNRNYTFELSGKNSFFSQNIAINTSQGSVINFTAFANDTIGIQRQATSILVNVNNTLPPKVELISPNTNNYTINRTPTFVWKNITDVDNDSILFNIKIMCIGCSSDNRDINTTNLNYTPSELQFFGDDNYIYNWSVTAIDKLSNDYGYGERSIERNITLDSYVSIVENSGGVDFGSDIGLGENDNTTDNSPNPFVLENEGNVYVNVSIYAEDDLWESEKNPTDKFQYKVDNTTELYSFDYFNPNTTTEFANFTSSPMLSIVNLSYHDNNDTAEIDLKIEVPADESPGVKESKIVFLARRSK